MTKYSFENSYQSDWNQFIEAFIEADTEEDVLFEEVKKWCRELHKFIEILYLQEPGYGTQMEIRWHWRYLKEMLERKNPFSKIAFDWFCSLLINMIQCDNPKIRESVWYAIGVDYFECGTDGYWLFLPLYRQLPEEELSELILLSCSIDWPAKKDTYRVIAANPKHHNILAEALYNSCNAYCFGAMKASEGLKILQHLKIEASLYEKVHTQLTMPVEIVIEEIIHLENNKKNNLICLLSINGMSRGNIFPTWFPYAELWIDDSCLCNLEHASYLGNNWNYMTQTYQIATPETAGRIFGFSEIIPTNLKGKFGLLKPI